MSKNDTLSVRQQKAIMALLAKPSVLAAAEAAGVSPKTLYRYLAEPAFRAALEAAQDEALQMLSGQLVTFLGMGLDALARALQSEDSRIAVQAAAVVLRHFVELRQHCALEQRVSALEQKASEVKNGKF